jgi:hypothetical protein
MSEMSHMKYMSSMVAWVTFDWCYKSVTRVLHECFKCVTSMYKGVTRVLQACYKSVTYEVLQEGCKVHAGPLACNHFDLLDCR